MRHPLRRRLRQERIFVVQRLELDLLATTLRVRPLLPHRLLTNRHGNPRMVFLLVTFLTLLLLHRDCHRDDVPRFRLLRIQWIRRRAAKTTLG